MRNQENFEYPIKVIQIPNKDLDKSSNQRTNIMSFVIMCSFFEFCSIRYAIDLAGTFLLKFDQFPAHSIGHEWLVINDFASLVITVNFDITVENLNHYKSILKEISLFSISSHDPYMEKYENNLAARKERQNDFYEEFQKLTINKDEFK